MSDLRWTKGRILLLLGRIILGGIFIYAAYAKLRPVVPGTAWSAASVKTSLLMFAFQVDSFQILSSANANLVAHWLPFFELLLGIWLAAGVWLRVPSLITTLLLTGFMGAIIHAYVLKQEINCGCFGPGEHVGVSTILRDSVFFLLSLAVTIGAFRMARNKPAPNAPAPSTAPLEPAR